MGSTISLRPPHQLPSALPSFIHWIRAAMDSRNVEVQTKATSVSSLWTRMNARQGLPFAQQAIVHMAKDADYVGSYRLTIWSTKWMTYDNVFFLSFVPPLAWLVIMKRAVPK